MIRTAFTELIGIEHPVVSAGMGGGHTSGELVGRVSEAGGLGVLGASFLPPEEVEQIVVQAREITSKPIGINLLLHASEDSIDAVLGLGAGGALDRVAARRPASLGDLRAGSRRAASR